MEEVPHNVYVGKKLRYTFHESIYYDTATPASWCISRLKEIRTMIPNVIIVSWGVEYKIDSDEKYKHWVKEVFPLNSVNYRPDFWDCL